jgi:hypothetical protein
MTIVRAILLGLAMPVLLVAGCAVVAGPSPIASAVPGATAAAGTGIRGVATAGPVCPVERVPPDPACAPRPVAGAVVLIRDASGAEVARATTAPDGTFAVNVGPGKYLVEPQPAQGLMGGAESQTVTVVEGVETTVHLEYDTGIR